MAAVTKHSIFRLILGSKVSQFRRPTSIEGGLDQDHAIVFFRILIHRNFGYTTGTEQFTSVSTIALIIAATISIFVIIVAIIVIIVIVSFLFTI